MKINGKPATAEQIAKALGVTLTLSTQNARTYQVGVSLMEYVGSFSSRSDLTERCAQIITQMRERSIEECLITIVDGQIVLKDIGDFEQELEAWVQREGGRAKEVAYKIRTTYYEQSTQLFLKNYDLKTLPDALGNLTQLQGLYLDRNQLTALPDALGNLTQLQGLYLAYNQLTALPDALRNLTQLQELYLSYNQLTALPDAIDNLTQLQGLYLAYNQFTAVPDALRNLTQLERLNLASNQLTALPDALLDNLTQLQKLDLSHNQFTAVPDAIDNLRQLQELFLGYNQFTAVPDALGNLTQLQWLDLSHNPNLIRLPLTLCQLSFLKYLYIRNCSLLTELPFSLGECAQITYLDIEGTQIPPETRDALLVRTAEKRRGQSLRELPSKLNLWKSFAGSSTDFAFVDTFSPHEKGVLYEWLHRLESAQDFRSNQEALARTVCEIISDLKNNDDFKKIFIVQVEENNRDCGDHAAMSLNDTYLFWLMEHKFKDLSPEEKLKTIVALTKTNILLSALRHLVGNEPEGVEIYLYYLLHLKERLGLITAVDFMLHRQIGKRDWISEDKLCKEVEDTYLNEVLSKESCQKLAMQDAKFKENWEKKFEGFAFDAEPRPGEEPLAYEARMSDLKAQESLAKQELLKAWVQKQLKT